MQDYVFLDVLMAEKNLEIFLNTRVVDVKTENALIKELSAVQSTTEKEFCFRAKQFIDASGDGFVGYRAGAEYMYGREGKEVFGEPHALKTSDTKVMGSSLLFTAKNMGREMLYCAPVWAYRYTEEELRLRDHSEITSGYWWIEASADDIIGDQDKVCQELRKMLFGIWDHIKNTKGHKAENYALDWIASIPAKRESRRFVGDYVLREQDLAQNTVFDDVVAYGGWNMDIHSSEGLSCAALPPNSYVDVKGCYGIPYRCLYSRNISNLFFAGRDISVSHIALASTRVMGTCSVIGQAVGTAAALCIQKGISPRDLLVEIAELQRELLKDDCYLPRLSYRDEHDIAPLAAISASSTSQGYQAENVLNGVYRDIGDRVNCWSSKDISADGEYLSLRWQQPQTIASVALRFDSNLSQELTITLSDAIRKKQRDYPAELIRNFTFECRINGKTVKTFEIKDNMKRFYVINMDRCMADEVILTIHNTYGAKAARVYGVNVYRV